MPDIIRDPSTLLLFGVMAAALPLLWLCGMWLVHRMQKGRDDKRR